MHATTSVSNNTKIIIKLPELKAVVNMKYPRIPAFHHFR